MYNNINLLDCKIDKLNKKLFFIKLKKFGYNDPIFFSGKNIA